MSIYLECAFKVFLSYIEKEKIDACKEELKVAKEILEIILNDPALSSCFHLNPQTELSKPVILLNRVHYNENILSKLVSCVMQLSVFQNYMDKEENSHKILSVVMDKREVEERCSKFESSTEYKIAKLLKKWFFITLPNILLQKSCFGLSKESKVAVPFSMTRQEPVDGVDFIDIHYKFFLTAFYYIRNSSIYSYS